MIPPDFTRRGAEAWSAYPDVHRFLEALATVMALYAWSEWVDYHTDGECGQSWKTALWP